MTTTPKKEPLAVGDVSQGPFHSYEDLASIGLKEAAKTAKAKPKAKRSETRRGRFMNDLVCLADVQPESVRWLWPGRLPIGKFSLLAGDPKEGKSQITAWIAASVTTGRGWEASSDPQCAPGKVVFLVSEDGLADTLRPRIEAAGADPNQCDVLPNFVTARDERGSETEAWLDLRRDLSTIANKLRAAGNVRLLVIDPITSYLGQGTDSHKAADVRAVLSPLSDMADALGIAILGVSHFNKAASMSPLHRIQGSGAFVQVARAVHVVCKHPDDPNLRLFGTINNSLRADPPTLAYRIETHILDGGIETSRIVWSAEPSRITVQEAMAATQTHPRASSATDEACDWLREILADGPLPVADVKAQGAELGYSGKVLYDASKKLGIDKKKNGFDSGWVWALP